MDKESALDSRRKFGQKLQDLRESLGISVEALAQTTRISQPFIKALEDGEFENLPGQVFGRGFVRSLIKTMGANEREWTEAYNDACGPASNLEGFGRGSIGRGVSGRHYAAETLPRSPWTPKSPRSPKITGGRRGSKRTRYSGNSKGLKSLTRILPLWVAGPVTGIVILLTLGLTFTLFGNRGYLGKMGASRPVTQFWSFLKSSPQNRQDLHLPPPDSKTTSVAKQPLGEFGSTLSQDQTQKPAALRPPLVLTNEDRPSSSSKSAMTMVKGMTPAIGAPLDTLAKALDRPAGELSDHVFQSGAQNITLVVVETAKVKIGFDGSSMKVIELKPETYRYQFNDRADLLIYDAGAIRIQYNGKDLGTLGQKGRIRRITLKPE